MLMLFFTVSVVTLICIRFSTSKDIRCTCTTHPLFNFLSVVDENIYECYEPPKRKTSKGECFACLLHEEM